MKFSTAVLAAGVVASGALAAPAPEAPAWTKPGVDGKFITYWKKKFGQMWKVEKPECEAPEPVPEEKCMTDDEADEVAAYFRDLIRGYTIEQALAGLTEDFVDYSSAVSIVINKGAAEPNNILEPIFTSREQFMNGHGKQQPIPFETTNVWHNCNGTVSMRWYTTRSAQGQATEAAAIALPGLVVLETIPAEEGNQYPYRVHTIYSGTSDSYRNVFVIKLTMQQSSTRPRGSSTWASSSPRALLPPSRPPRAPRRSVTLMPSASRVTPPATSPCSKRLPVSRV